MEAKRFRPVDLDRERCKGCINCMKRCPTEAIRVRDKKAHIVYEKCTGCGECVRICTHRAKRAVYDDFEMIHKYKYKIALAPPSLYGQFNNLDDTDYVLNGLKAIGFDSVFEVSRAAELVSLITREELKKPHKLPVISSACPAICELIKIRYPSLKDNLLKVLSPVEVAAKIVRDKAIKDGYASSEIGVFFISPCPAKVSALKQHDTTKIQLVDGIFSVSDTYFKLLKAMKMLTELQPMKNSGIVGIGWATIGGEAAGALCEKNLSADGIDNCINVLKEIENSELHGIDFVELNACPGGCVGGVMNIENPFVAKSKIKKIRKYLPVLVNKLEDYTFDRKFYFWEKDIDVSTALVVSDDINDAIRVMSEIEKIQKTLPLIDCGLCGAPSCRAFAEDVALGYIDIESCTMKD